jgi:HEPN domain-containing protein
MNRADFQRLSDIRLQEAKVLFQGGQYPGAYYLAGYSVECALKACVARQTGRYEFPDRVRAQRANVHDLEQLVQVARLEPDFRESLASNPALESCWNVIKDWDETSRYDRGISGAQAELLLVACSDRTNGLLPWIRIRW